MKITTPIFWTAVAGIAVCLVMTITTAISQKRAADAPHTVILPATPATPVTQAQ